ncbi:hypothetical protein RZS08_59530, partial [Arthrospira platensis SPKY1]|nr:hypothetical protein [Arthrospira platensis SPKY1]
MRLMRERAQRMLPSGKRSRNSSTRPSRALRAANQAGMSSSRIGERPALLVMASFFSRPVI